MLEGELVAEDDGETEALGESAAECVAVLVSAMETAALRLAVTDDDCDAPLVAEAAAVAETAGDNELTGLGEAAAEEDAPVLAEAAPEGDGDCDALVLEDGERAGVRDIVTVGEALAERDATGDDDRLGVALRELVGDADIEAGGVLETDIVAVTDADAE